MTACPGGLARPVRTRAGSVFRARHAHISPGLCRSVTSTLGEDHMPSTPDDLASRLRLIRREAYGEDGIADLAEALGLPAQTWRNCEDGVKVPGEVLLRFLLLTEAEPHWLL